MTEKDELVEVVAEMLRRQGVDEVRAVGTANRVIASIRPTIVEEVLREMLEPSEAVQYAGLKALDEGGLADCNCDQKDVWDAMLRAYAKSHGLDLTQDGDKWLIRGSRGPLREN